MAALHWAIGRGSMIASANVTEMDLPGVAPSLTRCSLHPPHERVARRMSTEALNFPGRPARTDGEL